MKSNLIKLDLEMNWEQIWIPKCIKKESHDAVFISVIMHTANLVKGDIVYRLIHLNSDAYSADCIWILTNDKAFSDFGSLKTHSEQVWLK